MRVCEYLTEPHRRRLGAGTALNVKRAVDAIEAEGIDPAALSAVLKVAAEQRIEDMTDVDVLREASDTAHDVADRIDAVLKDSGLWWRKP